MRVPVSPHSSALGPVGEWPQSLRTLVELVLINPAPSALLWGETGTLIYNDGYATICGGKHPQVFGGSVRDARTDAWDFNGKMLANCRAGHPQVFQNAHFVLERDGLMRDSWFDLYYAPVGGGGGAYEGVMATVVEITDRVLAEQANAARATELAAKLNSGTRTRSGHALKSPNRRLAGDHGLPEQSVPEFTPAIFAVADRRGANRFELTNAL
ncbi:hypothetical protein AB595_10985 [Massilia sp. WF1]|uniref:hypothetical protein n=1 Tax=Massilia sp. WF1 TaxID=1406431 RepID=UPI00064A769A|nr:hypothetical protein [Massilia sp. WF1]KLU36358.1 hypothetical protein AB595_10985 [Massilia sp. WF1]